MPWRILVSSGEKDRLLRLDWVRERLASAGARFMETSGALFALPVVERNRMLDCLFLDADGLCSIHKREGVAATPTTCRTFPFSFIREPAGLRPQFSHLCPSIRDNYGEPLAGILDQKIADIGQIPAKEAAPHMLAGTAQVGPEAYLAWADRIADHLARSPHPATALWAAHEWTRQLQDGDTSGWPDWPREPAEPAPAVAAPAAWPLSVRLLLALCLLPTSYPARNMLGPDPQHGSRKRIDAFRFISRLVRWRGPADILFVPREIDWSETVALPPVGSTPEAARRLSLFAAGLMKRRSFLLQPAPLGTVLFHVALCCSIAALHARCRCAAEHRQRVEAADLAEGESTAEFVHSHHGSLIQASRAATVAVEFMSLYPPAFRGLLATL